MTQNLDPKSPKDNLPTFEGYTMEQIANEVTKNKEQFIFVSDESADTDAMQEEDCLKICQRYAALNGIPLIYVIAGFTKLIQSGGTNQSKNNLTVKVNGYEFDINELRKLIQSQNKKLTVRKFAKGARKMVIAIALTNQWPGPLSKELARNNPNLVITPELAPWCNEIHSDNYDCPNEIRDALVRREEQLRILFKATVSNNKQKPRSQRGKKNKK
jgi:hypothetical protein